MTYIIAEPCIDIKDRSCVDVCPVDCIHEFERILVIDPEECIDCGACEPECPVEAIFPEDALPDKWDAFVKINYAFPEGADVINSLVQTYADENSLDATRPLPPVFTGRAGTEMRCVSTTLQDLHDHAWAHHIQRLMILGNLALQQLLHLRRERLEDLALLDRRDVFEDAQIGWVYREQLDELAQVL